MKNFKKLFSISLAILITISVFTGCNKKEEVSKEKIKDSLVYAIWSSPTGIFNPTVFDTEYDKAVIELCYSSLLKFDKKLNLKPDLAENYTISEDAKTIKFKINKNAKWQDGKALTAEDVAFTFESIANKDYPGGNFSDVENLKGAKDFHEQKSEKIEGIKVLDSNTIEFTFENVYAPGLINIGSMAIIPKHIWSKIPISTWKENKDALYHPIGSGPFKLVEFKPGQFVKLERFEEYYAKKAKTKNFIFKVSNQDTAQAELVNGSIDIMEVSSFQKRDLDALKNKNMKVITYPNSDFQYLGFNLRNSILNDKNLRKAFAYGINRKSMVDHLLEGNGSVLNAPMSPKNWAYPKEDVLNPYEYNIETAKEYLKKAGYEDKNNDGIVENSNGEKLTLSLKYPIGNKTREKTAPIIQSDLKKIGIEVKLESLEFPVLMEQVVGNHEFDLYLMANTLGSEPNPKPYWHSTSASDKKGDFAWNMTGFRNKEADSLIEQGISTMDINKRKEIYKSFEQLMNEELPWVTLYCQNVGKAYNPNVKNFDCATYIDFFNVEDWYVVE